MVPVGFSGGWCWHSITREYDSSTCSKNHKLKTVQTVWAKVAKNSSFYLGRKQEPHGVSNIVRLNS